MPRVNLDYKKCEGSECGECADVCPMDVLVLEGDEIKIQFQEECNLCEVCMDVCPNDAINIEE